MPYRTALITGASRGIGLGLTKELLATGATVVATVRSASNGLSELAANAGGRLHIVQLDTGSSASITACVEGLKKQFQHFDVRADFVGSLPLTMRSRQQHVICGSPAGLRHGCAVRRRQWQFPKVVLNCSPGSSRHQGRCCSAASSTFWHSPRGPPVSASLSRMLQLVVNNAGILEEIRPFGEVKEQELLNAFQVWGEGGGRGRGPGVHGALRSEQPSPCH